MMPFMGVRISWLMLATKTLLARLAVSAASLALQHGLLGQHAFGYVPRHALRADHFSLRVVHRRFEDLDVFLLAVASLEFFDRFENLSALDHPAIVVPDIFAARCGGEKS